MDAIGIVTLVLCTGLSLLLVPDISAGNWFEPTILAAIGTPILLAVLVGLRVKNAAVRWERAGLALFLLLMPTVYLSSLALHGGGAIWLVVEALGQVLFAAVALTGWRKAPWVLAVGLAGHGLAWDSWHHGRTDFIPDWYTLACLLVDIGCGTYALSRLKVWNAAARSERTAPDEAYDLPASAARARMR